MKFIAFILFLGSLSACGSDPVFIADEVRFRVNFSAGWVRTEFDLNRDYSFNWQELQSFESLGSQKVGYREINDTSFIQSTIYPRALKGLPLDIGEDLKLFPNAQKLPRPTEKMKLVRWVSDRSSFIFSRESHLNYGGSFEDHFFEKLPENFMAIQDFKDDRGNAVASIAILGPSKNFTGGVFFFSYLGENPFLDKDSQSIETLSLSFHATDEVQTSRLTWLDLWKLIELKDLWKSMKASGEFQ